MNSLSASSSFPLLIFFLASMVVVSCVDNHAIERDITTHVDSSHMSTDTTRPRMSIYEISKEAYEASKLKNFNATVVNEVDTTIINNAIELITSRLTDDEIDFLESELCESLDCYTSFEGYYPEFDAMVFYIMDPFYEKAVFIKKKESDEHNFLNRFYGSCGIMSQTGRWAGLKRKDCDNYLQLQVCAVSNTGGYSILKISMSQLDVNIEDISPMHWVDANTLHISAIEWPEKPYWNGAKKYYAISF